MKVRCNIYTPGTFCGIKAPVNGVEIDQGVYNLLLEMGVYIQIANEPILTERVRDNTIKPDTRKKSTKAANGSTAVHTYNRTETLSVYTKTHLCYDLVLVGYNKHAIFEKSTAKEVFKTFLQKCCEKRGFILHQYEFGDTNNWVKMTIELPAGECVNRSVRYMRQDCNFNKCRVFAPYYLLSTTPITEDDIESWLAHIIYKKGQ